MLLLAILGPACVAGPSSPEPSPLAATSTVPPRPTSARPSAIRVELYEWSIATEPLQVAPGQYTVEIVNRGKRIHSLAIAGGATDLESRRIGENLTTTVQVTLRPGEYTLWCPIGDHREMGMLDFLTVE